MQLKCRSGETCGIDFVEICAVSDFDISKIFDCGQCFRFDLVENSPHEAEFSGIAHGRFISVAQDGDKIRIYNCTEAEYLSLWRHYLGLDRDYAAINREILSANESEHLSLAAEKGRGIRILAQEEWETICSFIISQNNNIPRIKKIIEALSARCGEPISIPEAMESKKREGQALYSFPSAEAVYALGIDGIAELRTGFRAKYIFDAAEKVKDSHIDYRFLRSSESTQACIEHLRTIKGVGPKVASCALLFGFERYDAFPVDVWIKKVISKYFGVDAGEFSPDMLGKYAGIAQQYLFYYERYIASRKEALNE